MKKLLLASVSAVALASGANAADMAIKAAPVVPPVPYWQGFYLGVEGGAVRHDASFNDLSGGFSGSPATFATSKSGGIFGGYAGYNWQSRSFVYGVEADISWLGVKATETWGAIFAGSTRFEQSQEVSWLSTFRGRAGIDYESTLFFLTGGLAVAQVKNSFNGFCGLNPCAGVGAGAFVGGFSQDTTRVGWTVGAGFEHMFDSHWTLRGEFRYVDLGRSIGQCHDAGVGGGFCAAFGTGGSYRGEFSNALMIGTVGVGYKF